MSDKKIALIDCDTILFQAACVIDERFILVEHLPTGKTKEFENKTAFKEFILGRNKDITKYKIIEESSREKEPVENACHVFKNSMNRIIEQEWCNDYMIYLGGVGNYRKDIFPYYKSSRGSKPTRYKEIYNFIINKYKEKVHLCNKQEAEDCVGIVNRHYVDVAIGKYNDPRKSESVICAVDKDTDMLLGWRFNYNKPELGLFFQDELHCFKSFASQCLRGDQTDDIQGLEGIGDITKSKYSIKYKGIGKKTAEMLLEPLKDKREVLDLIVEFYKDYYKDSWKLKLNENALLLKIREYDNELWDIDSFCKQQGWRLYE